MNLKNKNVIITGGSSGIGRATAQLAVENGANVLITGRDEKKLRQVAQDLNVAYFHADVSVEKDIQATYDWIHTNWNGKLDVLVNNAGVGYRRSVDEMEWEDFETIFNVNVFGAALMAKYASLIFKKQGSGNIVNIGSTASLKGYPTGSVYAASKFALRGLTQCWQAELRKYNVRVFQINPSEVTTAFAQVDRVEREPVDNKLTAQEIAHAIITGLKMDDRGFVPEMTIWATNPF